MTRRWTRRILVANLVGEIGIVLTGGLVRLTGSGLGCSTWPECEPGTYTPTFQPETGYHAYVEFGNRTLTGIVGVLAIACLLAVLLERPRRRRLVLLAAGPLIGVIAQIVLGGITVLTDLNPALVAGHFLVSMGLVTVSTALLLRHAEGDAAPRSLVHPALRVLARALAAVAAVVLVLGTVVTGSGPHSGDAVHPTRLPFDPQVVSWLHADVVMLFSGLVVGVLVGLKVSGAPATAVRRGWQVLAVTLAQGALGYTQYALDVARPLVWLHMLGACLLVVSVTALLLSLRTRGPVPPETAAADERPRIAQPA